jgi:hypothetical protein
VAAGEHRLGLVIERAQELALPAVPDAGADRLDVADRQHEKHLQPLEALHHRGEIEDGLPIVEVARLGGHRHQEMMLDEPGDILGLQRRQAEARAKPARDTGARDRVILGPALGDIVQEERDIEDDAVLDGGQDLARQRVAVGLLAALDLGELADRAEEMLVDRVVMIHVELHHRDDAAEIRHEASEHAGLVHPPEHQLRLVSGGEDFQKQAVRFRVVPKRVIDEAERARHLLHGVGVEGEVRLVRKMEDADEVDRVALEDLFVGDVDAVVVDDEIRRAGNRAGRATARREAEEAIEGRDRLAVMLLQ